MHRLDFPEQTLRPALKMREKCASGKTLLGFRETQLARTVRHAGGIQKTDGHLPLIATQPGEGSAFGEPPGGAGPSLGGGPAQLHPRRYLFQWSPRPPLAESTVGTKPSMSIPP